jgi:hypothetical protein
MTKIVEKIVKADKNEDGIEEFKKLMHLKMSK